MLKYDLFYTLPDIEDHSSIPVQEIMIILIPNYQHPMYHIWEQKYNPCLIYSFEWNHDQCSMAWIISIWGWVKKRFHLSYNLVYFWLFIITCGDEYFWHTFFRNSVCRLGRRISCIKIHTFGIRTDIELLGM